MNEQPYDIAKVWKSIVELTAWNKFVDNRKKKKPKKKFKKKGKKTCKKN